MSARACDGQFPGRSQGQAGFGEDPALNIIL